MRNATADTASAYTNLTNSGTIVLEYDGTNYTLTRLSDDTQWSNASLTTLSTTVAASEGFQISSVGAVAAGDSFLIYPTKDAARNISRTVRSPPTCA